MRAAHHYILKSWRHLLPHRGRAETLTQVGRLLSSYDVVALQEVDVGSFRSQQIDQVAFLSEQSGLKYRAQQVTRDLGKFAQCAKGILSRYPLENITSLNLPGSLPGRGVLMAEMGFEDEKILLINVHFSLNHRNQLKQLDFLETLVKRHRYVVVMGDFNMEPHRLMAHPLIAHGVLEIANKNTLTFPSWKAKKCLDYVLISPALTCQEVQVLPCGFSDHLPVSVRIQVPEEVAI